jgi:hypothetical protein
LSEIKKGDKIMANRREEKTDNSRSQEERVQGNGIAGDVQATTTKTTRTLGISTEEFQGYAFLTGGILLFIHTLGYFEVLNWFLMASAVALIIYGAKLANLVQRTKELYQYLRKKFAKK